MFKLSATYANIPKHLIQGNPNMLLLFKDDLNFKNVYHGHGEKPYCFNNSTIFKDNFLNGGKLRKEKNLTVLFHYKM